MNENPDRDFFAVPKRAMLGIAPAIAIIAVLLAKDKAPQVLLFLVGISAGLVIGTSFRQQQK